MTSTHLARLILPAVLALALPMGAAQAETDFLARFQGEWTGSGEVQRRADEGAQSVNCTMAGQSGAATVAIGGTCRAYLIFSREVGADIRVDPATGRYTGTYRGSTIGTAQLDGTRNGNVVDLTITWPAVVNGDQTAKMQIINDGSGALRIVVSDQIGAGGPVQTTTDLRLSRR